MANPFVYDRALPADALVGREEDLSALMGAVADTTNVTLYGPRRVGKTSLIGALLARAGKEGLVTVYVDFYGVLTLDDVAGRIRASYSGSRSLPRKAGDLVASVLASIQLGPLGAELRSQPTAAADQVTELLDLPLRMLERTGRQTVVAFDEFQALLDVAGADGLLRSRIQHHGEAATYVFAGSEPSLLGRLFRDRARPLYGQARPYELGLIEAPAFTEAIGERFHSSGRSIDPPALAGLVALGAGHPQRTMLLAHHAWARTAPRGTASEDVVRQALDEALSQLDPEFRGLWEACTANQRRVLAALAQGVSPRAPREVDKVGLKQPSSAQTALDALAGEGVVDAHGRTIRDPLLAAWLRRVRGSR